MPQSIGKKFEEDFAGSCPFFIHRVRDSFYKGAMSLCDFIMFNGKYLYLLELKSTKGASLPFSMMNFDQLEKLVFESGRPGVFAKYVVNFSEKGKTYMINVEQIQKFIESTERKSIPIAYFEQFGTLIPQTLKRTRYRYHFEKWRL